MVAWKQNPLEDSRFPEESLVGILAEMVKSALQWEAESRLESDADSILIHDASGIDYPPTDPQPVPIP